MADKVDTSPSRRQLVGAGATLAATSLASSATKRNEGIAAQAFGDPKQKYPKPTFEQQPRPWPGLAGSPPNSVRSKCSSPPTTRVTRTIRSMAHRAGAGQP